MTRTLFLKLYPFYIPNNSIDFCSIYSIVICIRGVLKKNVKNNFPQLIKSIAFFHIKWHNFRNPIISIMIITSSSVCYSVCCYRTLHRCGQTCQIDTRQLMQTFAVVIIVKNISHVIQPQFYIIMTNALLSPNAFSQHFFINLGLYKQGYISNIKFLDHPPHETHTNHVKNIFCIFWNSKFHKKATSLQHCILSIPYTILQVIWDTFVTITGCAFWYKSMKKLKKS